MNWIIAEGWEGYCSSFLSGNPSSLLNCCLDCMITTLWYTSELNWNIQTSVNVICWTGTKYSRRWRYLSHFIQLFGIFLYTALVFLGKYELLFKDIDWVIHGNTERTYWIDFKRELPCLWLGDYSISGSTGITTLDHKGGNSLLIQKPTFIRDFSVSVPNLCLHCFKKNWFLHLFLIIFCSCLRYNEIVKKKKKLTK